MSPHLSSPRPLLTGAFFWLVILIGLLVGVAIPARAQELAPDPAGGWEGILLGLVVPYVAHGLSVASVLGVLRWFVPALRKRPGEKKLAPEQVRLIRVVLVALAVLSTVSGRIPPLGGDDAGIAGLVGAGALVALLAHAMRDGLRAVLARKKGGA